MGNVKLSNREPFKNYLAGFSAKEISAPLGEILPLDGIKLNFMAKIGLKKAKDRLQRAKNSVFRPKIPACWVKKVAKLGVSPFAIFFSRKHLAEKIYQRVFEEGLP